MQRHSQPLSKINNEKHAEMFEKVKQAIVAIQSKKHSSLSFEVLYRSSYTLVCEKHGDLLLEAYQKLTKQHLTETVTDFVMPELLRCVDASGNFLEILCRFWNDYSIMLGMIRDILIVYIQPGMLSVYQSALSMFRTEVNCVHVVNDQIQHNLLSMISSERQGQSIQWGIIKSIVRMLMALGIESRNYYEDNFERFFLKETEDHYKLCLFWAAERFIAEKSSIEYIEKVHECLAYESDRCKRYLDSLTEVKVNALLINILASESKVAVILEKKKSGLEFMLNNKRINDLMSLFEFVKYSKVGPKRLVDILRNYVCIKGKQIMSSIETKTSNPIDSIQEIINLNEQLDDYLVNAFKNDQACREAIQSAIEEFFNSSTRSPEHLSLYIDDKLKKGAKEANNLATERTLDNAMLLFKHMQEKDVFERYYKQHLAKRLLLNKSGSNDTEKYMISRLKDKCGSIYTKKLEGMFADIDVSNTLNEEYKSIAQGDVEICVSVLTAVHWPTSSHISPCKLPLSLSETFAHYQAFYISKYNGRKIDLYPVLGNADLKAAFYNNLENESAISDVKILNVTVYTMVVLMCFNDSPVLKFSELLRVTNIQEKELQRCLQSLAMGKATQRILCRKGSGKVIELSDEFSVNENFSSKLRRIKVQPISIRESEPEVVETRQKIDEERKHEIEASIVRVMKSRKELNHNNLFTEVVNQLKSRFSPDPLLFKKRIESLIEREYLRRHNDSNHMYTYVA